MIFPIGVNAGFVQSHVLPLRVAVDRNNLKLGRLCSPRCTKGAALLCNEASNKKALFSQEALGRMRRNSLHLSRASSHVHQRHREKLLRRATQESCRLSIHSTHFDNLSQITESSNFTSDIILALSGPLTSKGPAILAKNFICLARPPEDQEFMFSTCS